MEKWIEKDTYEYIIYQNNLMSNKIVGFDFDDTIIIRKDYTLIKYAIKHLRTEIKDGKRILIITNQSGLETRKKPNKNDWRKIVENLINVLISNIDNYYIGFYVSKDYDRFRKPNTGLWEKAISKIDNSKSLYFCGDAGGRKGDFSDTDRKLAYNLNIKFYCPEELFLGEEPKPFNYKGYIPKKYPKLELNLKQSKNKEVVIIGGYPSSGKTSIHSFFFDNYTLISQDLCKTYCLKLFEQSLKNNESIYVEGLLYTNSMRHQYIDLIKKYNYKFRYFEIDMDIDLAFHLNNVRHLTFKTKYINKIVYLKYRKNYEIPNFDYELINPPFNKWKENEKFFNNFFVLSEALK